MEDAIKMLKEKWYPPADCTESFEGKTVLVTGANTGIGLEAAKKLAALNAKQLIITTRSVSKGDATKKQIETWLSTSGSTSKTQIVPLILDMGTADGVKAFTKELASRTDRLDSAILNAGMNQPQCTITSDGFEETLQVNTISTVLLATLLLPLMTATSEATSAQTHITIVSSRIATYSSSMPPQKVQSSPTPVHDLGKASGFPKGMIGGQTRYGESKLLLEYAIRHMSRLPALNDKNGKPKVIINSVCPGATKTDIGRNYSNPVFKFLMYAIFYPLFAKSAAQGANAYLTALTAGDKSRGRMWTCTQYAEEWDAVKSEKGKAFGDKVWEELQEMMTVWEPSVKELLA